MNEIAPKTYVQKSNIENDNLIDGKDILLGLLVSIARNAELASPIPFISASSLYQRVYCSERFPQKLALQGFLLH
jgi:hypothetical protein